MGFALAFVCFYSFFNPKEQPQQDPLTQSSDYHLTVVKEQDAWLYKIYRNHALYIKQDYIPAVNGRQRFQSKSDAEQIGTLVLNKLNNNELPLVTKEELLAHHIVYKVN